MSHLLTDGLGSVRGTLSDALAVNDQTDYTPFGEQQSSLGTDFAFTGELLDANGLQHHRARYYNPTLGVWASLDPVEGSMGNPMTLNRYGYVSGNPINNVDPTGMFTDYGVGGVSYANMSAFGQLRTRQLQARVSWQYALLAQLVVHGGLLLLNWVRNQNNCGDSIASSSTTSLGQFNPTSILDQSNSGIGGGNMPISGGTNQHIGQSTPCEQILDASDFDFEDCVNKLRECWTKFPPNYDTSVEWAEIRCAQYGRRRANTTIATNSGCVVEVLGYNTSARFNHTFLIFTDQAGIEYSYSAGPDILAGAGGASDMISGDLDAFGIIIVETGIFGPNLRDYREYSQVGGPRLVLTTIERPNMLGSNRACSEIKGCLDDEAARIEHLGVRYNPLGPNSNTFTSRMLRACELPWVVPFGANDLIDGAPGWYNAGLE